MPARGPILPIDAYRQLVLASGCSRLVLSGNDMKCSLCRIPTGGWSIKQRRHHYRRHWKAAEKELAALASLASLRRPAGCRFGWEAEAVEATNEIFGFTGGTAVAQLFWEVRR